MKKTPARLAAFALSAHAFATASFAQDMPEKRATVMIGPYVGLYTPIGVSTADSAATVRQIGGLVFGARLSYEPSRAWGLEGALSWSPAQAAVTDATSTVDVGSSVLMSSVRARFNFNHGDGLVFFVAPGAGLIRRSSEVWQAREQSVAPAFVLGTGIHTVHQGIHLGFDVESFATSSRLQSGGNRVRGDVVWSFSMRFEP